MTRGTELLFALALLTAGLAGCIGTDDAPVDTANAADEQTEPAANASTPTFPNGTPAPTRVERVDCVEHFAFFPAPASAYRDRLPPGFALVPYADEPTGQTATVEVFAQRCELADGTTERRAGTVLVVDPPDAWANPDADFGHGIALSMVTTAERVAAVDQAWGFEHARAGEASLGFTATPAARTGTMEANAGDVSLSLSTAVTGQEAPAALSGHRATASPSPDDQAVIFRSFALGENGTVVGAKDRTSSFADEVLLDGTGTAQGSPAAGLPETPGVLHGDGGHVLGWNTTDVHVDLPPREER